MLRADRHPLRAEVGGRTRPLWMLFAGNGTYHRMGLAPGRRSTWRTGGSTSGWCTAAAGPRCGCCRRPSPDR
ncbi:hypothetical protein Sdagh_14520 [Streptomyces daghestanicus]|uniref:Uncharacterized protein n=1 Tax=Streptomyces daghestanicus TaxID=66885 RepID=A0ABQ3PXH8_9ACTN|nr:hypothetical protein Sdagh_14520 [Streptomyces daghestanicus]